ncbi:MAG: aminoacyl-tRNA hydrolase [Candidatus Pacebacteria bacterium]|nr:aminoacyl-tRNA hydrolase [Candidatus Paceibacterota bacterium]
MILIVGLGNPGGKYRDTRHNVGSEIIDELNLLNLRNVVLAKPRTFMNESGKAVKELLKKHRLESDDLVVIHDDIDIPLGKIRIVKNRGAAGHKGVESIIKEINSQNFIRLRIGIKPEKGKPKNPENFVLQNFNKKEEKILEEVIKKTVQAVEVFLKEGLERAMNEFNK